MSLGQNQSFPYHEFGYRTPDRQVSYGSSPNDDYFEEFPSNITYYSFPSPLSGRSPTLPSFRIPKYGYYNLEGGVASPFEVAPNGTSSTGKNSIFRALIQSINFFVGIGVLTLPYALRTTGWFGLVLLLLFGSIMTYTAWLYGRSRESLYLENFSDHIEFAFSTKGRVVISLIFYASLLINAGLFVKLFSDTLSSLLGLEAMYTLSITTAVFILMTNLCTSATLPVTRVMSILGTLSTVVLVLALIAAEILALQELKIASHRQKQSSFSRIMPHSKSGVWSYTSAERVYITDLIACLKTLGIFGYCYMGHEVFPAIFHNMKHPTRYAYVVYIAFTSMLLCYATIASLGYVTFGAHSSGNIVDNLPARDPLTVGIKICVLVTVLAKLTLSSAPLTEGLTEWTRLVGYLVTHLQCLAGWSAPPAGAQQRHAQSLRVQAAPPRTHITSSSAEQRYRERTSSILQVREPLDLNRPRDRRRYFDTSYYDIEEEVKALNTSEPNESSRLLVDRRNPLSGLSLQDPATMKSSDPIHIQFNGSGSTADPAPQRVLTWSDTVAIPPIRSPQTDSYNTPHQPHSAGSAHPVPLVQLRTDPVATFSASEAQQQGRSLSNLTGLLSHPLSRCAPAAVVRVPPVAEDLDKTLNMEQSEPSSEESSPTSTNDLFYSDCGESIPLHSSHHLRGEHELVDTNLSQEQPPQPHIQPTPPAQQQNWCVTFPPHTCCVSYFLPVLLRCAVPLAALLISVQFDSLVSMVIFTGGVCGGCVSILIPTLTYYKMHHLELGMAHKCLLGAIIAGGAVLAIATVIAASL